MEPQTTVKPERKQFDFTFITEIIQRGRIRPAKFRHSLEIPCWLYEELRDKNIIRPDRYYINESAFFEMRHERIIISFVCCGLCDALQFAIDRHLIIEYAGKYPIERKYVSKMNFDKPARELVVLQRTKTGKKSRV